MTLEMKDSNIIVPRNIFDVLDVVEDYIGTDIREYLENWLEEPEEPPEMDEHYIEVLETAEYELGKLSRQKKKEQQATLERVLTMLRREINGKTDV